MLADAHPQVQPPSHGCGEGNPLGLPPFFLAQAHAAFSSRAAPNEAIPAAVHAAVTDYGSIPALHHH
eukprot:CAMPEP_0172939970 /NCGR_PEP_ID=MMETSP1075-20121228/223796_1 /TAXON_ID=2916 /ORGANISM="Ceratium fusus, Strain PA161109" /LENGTH=66 /DNA_ID=CAMNT_0013801361 /DNA_START=35 /DNA_END=235 /DNA_ORIENTATION=-